MLPDDKLVLIPNCNGAQILRPPKKNSKMKKRSAKFLPLLNVLSFPNLRRPCSVRRIVAEKSIQTRNITRNDFSPEKLYLVESIGQGVRRDVNARVELDLVFVVLLFFWQFLSNKFPNHIQVAVHQLHPSHDTLLQAALLF